jgi:hypothetical protein
LGAKTEPQAHIEIGLRAANNSFAYHRIGNHPQIADCNLQFAIGSHYDVPMKERVVCAPDVVTGILHEAENCNLLMIGTTGERLFEQRLFGSIPERVARETTKTVIMTKRYWRLKSLLGRMTKTRQTQVQCSPPSD